jgi:hypothetical protein
MLGIILINENLHHGGRGKFAVGLCEQRKTFLATIHDNVKKTWNCTKDQHRLT